MPAWQRRRRRPEGSGGEGGDLVLQREQLRRGSLGLAGRDLPPVRVQDREGGAHRGALELERAAQHRLDARAAGDLLRETRSGRVAEPARGGVERRRRQHRQAARCREPHAHGLGEALADAGARRRAGEVAKRQDGDAPQRGCGRRSEGALRYRCVVEMARLAKTRDDEETDDAGEAGDSRNQGRSPQGPLALGGDGAGADEAAGVGHAVADRVELLREIARRGIAGRRVLGEAASHDPGERCGKLRLDVRQARRLGVQDGRQRVESGRAGEGTPPGEHLEQNDAEGELVRAEVERQPARLFRRHIGDGAEQATGLRGERRFHARMAGGLGEGSARCVFGEAEVEDLDQTLGGDHHVVRLEIAVDDPFLVRRGEAMGDLRRDRNQPAQRGKSLFDPRREAPAEDELHRDVGEALVLADLVNGDDVRMVQGRGGARLLSEAQIVLRTLVEALGEQLDRDDAPEGRVARAVEPAHAAGAELAQDLEAADVRADDHGRATAPRRRNAGPPARNRGSTRGL